MKHLFFLFSLLFFSFTANSQSFRFGVKAGANYADINGNDLEKDSHRYKLGWHAGGLVNIQYPGNTWFSIQPEIIYSRKGYENFSPETEVRNAQGTLLYSAQSGGFIRLNYIDIPVMLNFRTGIIVFEFGPQFSYLVGFRNDAIIRQIFPDESVTTVEDEANKYTRFGTKKLDLGLSTGFRLETQNGVGLGIRFNQGFVKLAPSISDIRLAPEGRNQVFQLYASFMLPE